MVFLFSSFPKKSRSFLNRCLIFILVIILSFNFICKPKKVEAAVVGSLTVLEITAIIGALTALGGLGLSVYNTWKENSGETDDYQTYFNKNISVDGSGNYVISDAGMVTINEMAEIAKEKNYQYGYFPTNANISVDSFSTKSAYDIATTLIAKYPDKVFRFNSSVIPGMADIKGDEGGKLWDWCSGWKVTVYDVPYGAVGNVSGLSSVVSQANCYTEDWQLEFPDVFEVYIVDWSGVGFLCYWDKDGTYHEIPDYKAITPGCIDDAYAYSTWKPNTKLNSGLSFSSAYFSQSNLPAMNLYCYSNYSGGIPVFNSLADLKRGTEGKSPLQPLPGYTGQPITNNTISQKEINDYSTNYNYYYGNGSGNDPGGPGSGSGSGSSGNWLESLLGSLSKLGDIIMTLVSKVVDIITDILKFFTDTLADAMDIIPEGFIRFLGALFPFIPKEWLTAVSLALALMLIGVIIKVLKNIF